MSNFSNFNLIAPLVETVSAEGYTTPTPIQTQAIPLVLAGHDLLGIAQTGTGKTAAFALPVLHRLSTDKRSPLRKGCRVLILAPTRELAVQISECFRVYGRKLGLSVAVIVGGVASRPQAKALANGVDVLVATPGRLLDHVREKAVVLSATETFILDEADQMLDLGFIKPIRQIAAMIPARRQCLLFSATMPQEIAALADSLLQNPKKVAVTPVASTSERVSQRVILVESARKKSMLVELLSNKDMGRTLIFTRTKRGADRVARHLESAGIKASAIHGNKSQNQRQQALGDFKKGKVAVLVATDIAARGIDVDDVTHVVNYELPEIPESYVHRIGRTARAGASGSAIAFCDNSERHLLRDIERLTKRSLPTEDRRSDAALAADPASDEAGSRDRRGRHSAGDRGRNHSRGQGEHRGHGKQEGAGQGRAPGRDSGRRGAALPKASEHNDQRGDQRRQSRNGDQAPAGSALANVGFLASEGRRLNRGGQGNGTGKSRVMNKSQPRSTEGRKDNRPRSNRQPQRRPASAST